MSNEYKAQMIQLVEGDELADLMMRQGDLDVPKLFSFKSGMFDCVLWHCDAAELRAFRARKLDA